MRHQLPILCLGISSWPLFILIPEKLPKIKKMKTSISSKSTYTGGECHRSDNFLMQFCTPPRCFHNLYTYKSHTNLTEEVKWLLLNHFHDISSKMKFLFKRAFAFAEYPLDTLSSKKKNCFYIIQSKIIYKTEPAIIHRLDIETCTNPKLRKFNLSDNVRDLC